MKSFFILAYFSLLACANGTTNRVTPVQKVLQLLQGMIEKGKKEKKDEEIQFAKYKQWCDDTIAEKQNAIEEANEVLQTLRADIQKYEADAQLLVEEVAKIDEDVSVWSGDMKAAENVRQVEKEDYVATHQEYTEAIDALGMAIAVLKKHSGDVKQAAAVLTQVKSSSLIPQDSRRVIEVFLAQDPDASFLAVSAPEANAYEFQSQGIIDMLTKLENKFEDEQRALEKQEQQSQYAFETLVQNLKDQTQASETAREEKATAKAKKLQGAASAKTDLIDTTATRDDDSKYLKDLSSTCNQKASDFQSRQVLRSDEIAALQKAIDILSSEEVSGAAEQHLPALLQARRRSSFAQLRSVALNPSQARVSEYLKSQATLLNSRILAAIAVRVEADPFKKVKKMLKDLILKLMEEAGEEAEHKDWCDNELTTNEVTRKEKTEAVELLRAEIDEVSASIAKLTHDLTELSKAVADLDSAVASYTESRSAEKEKNTATIKDAQDAQSAVAQAITVLKEFYSKDAESPTLLQQPQVFDTEYKGMQTESGGVVGMLEVIQSDFARLEAETKATEDQAKKEFDRFMTDSQVDKVQKNADIEHKTEKKQDEQQSLLEQKTELHSTQAELDAALAYYEKLKPSCVNAGVSYEFRVARRKEEIASLQEALRILNGEDVNQLESSLIQESVL